MVATPGQGLGRGLISGAGEATTGGRPIGPTGGPGAAGEPVRSFGAPPVPTITGPTAAIVATPPVGGAASTFNIGGAPIALLGGVFRGGLPIGGPVGQIFRGTAPLPNTLFIDTISPGGPIGLFFLGTSGAPIGLPTFGGGGLPIEPSPLFAREIVAIGPLTANVVGPPPPPGGGPITGMR